MANKSSYTLDDLKQKVIDLYHFRDHYFETFGIEAAAEKNERLKKKLDETIEIFDQVNEQFQDQVEYLMLRGKALNVLSTYDNEATSLLERAVKKDPKLTEAWICLGECFWKNGKIETSRNCFNASLSHKKDKVALRSLSMITRKLGANAEERAKNVEESLEMAKEAVQMDISDGTSWFVLGNAYLTMFFQNDQNPTFIKQCLTAYRHAEKDVVAATNLDLHHNRATVYHHQEDYELALQGYSRAASLDPTFVEPKEKEKQLLQFITQLNTMVATKGKIRAKKLKSLADSINKTADLGVYSSESYKDHSGSPVKLQLTGLESLKPGKNEERVIIGKVVCSVNADAAVCFTFCIIDSTQKCVAVTVYNMAAGWGVKIGDSITIPEPEFRTFDFKYNDQHFCFDSIRVDSPALILVNGRKPNVSSLVPSRLTVVTKSE